MSALQVVAVVTAKEGSADVVREALATLAYASRREGECLAYDVHESAAAPGTFLTTEQWGSRGDLDAHMQTEHFQRAVADTTGHLSAAPAIHPLQPVLVG